MMADRIATLILTLSPALLALAGVWVAYATKKQIRKQNEFLKQRWTGEVKSDDPRVHGYEARTVLDPVSGGKTKQVAELSTVKLSAPTIRVRDADYAIYGVAERSTIETMKQFLMVCDSFEKLGWNDFAHRMRQELTKQDFGVTERSTYNWILAQVKAKFDARKKEAL